MPLLQLRALTPFGCLHSTVGMVAYESQPGHYEKRRPKAQLVASD